MTTTPLPYNWETDILPHISSLQPVQGGFTTAKRGIATLEDGSQIFIKIANDELTKGWLDKETEVYQRLSAARYRYMPKLLAVSKKRDAIAIEYLENASFENTWNRDKLQAVLLAKNALLSYKSHFLDDPLFAANSVVELELRWPALTQAKNLEVLNKKLEELGLEYQFSLAELQHYAAEHIDWTLKEDSLIHMDIRADNFGYDTEDKFGKLIDWNWLCIGDSSLDTTGLFVNIYLSGFDPYKAYPELYDRKMVLYILSYWLFSIFQGDHTASEQELNLRQFQARNIRCCLEILEKYS